MKKLLICTLALLTLVGCTTNNEIEETKNPTVKISATTDNPEMVEEHIASFAGVTVEEIEKQVFSNELAINDEEFHNIIARALFLGLLDHKFGLDDAYNSPSETFITGHDDVVIQTPFTKDYLTLQYGLDKNRVSFDDAPSLLTGMNVSSALLKNSMSVARYRYLINDIIEAELVITKTLGYPGDDVSYTASFVLTAVGTKEYITTSVTSINRCDINEAVHLSAFTNELYNTLTLMKELVDDSYLTDMAYEEVLQYKTRFSENLLDMKSSILVSQGEIPIYYNQSLIDSKEASLGQKMLNTGLEDKYKLVEYGTYNEYITPEGYKIMELNNDIGYGKNLNYPILKEMGITGVSALEPFNLYCSIAQVNDSYEIVLYCDLDDEKKYIVASSEDRSYVVEYNRTYKSKTYMYLFDLIGKSLDS